LRPGAARMARQLHCITRGSEADGASLEGF
jgi:hypothetical protein